MRGMLVHLLAPVDGTLSNGGVSERCSKFVATGCGMPQIFEPTADAPEVRLEEWYGHYRAVPVQTPERPYAGPMFGGGFVHTSDSRWADVTGGHPVPLHDRFEYETYAID